MSISKLGLKLSLLSSVLVLAVIATMAHRLLDASSDAFLAEKRARAEAFARSCREAVFPRVDAFALHFTLGELMQEPGMVYAQVVDNGGKVLSHSDSGRVGELDESPQGRVALDATSTVLQLYTGKDGVEYLDFSVPVLARTKPVGAVRLGITRRSLEQALAPDKRRILAIAAVGVLVAMLGTVLLVGWLTRPLPMLANAARDIGRGKLDTRVEWKSRDEIGVLARSFNEMAVANQLAFAALKEEKEKLDTIFSETRDGLILSDPGGRFLLINPTARRLLGFGDSSLTPMNSPSPGILGAFRGFEAEPPLDNLIEATDRVLSFELRRKEPKLLILAGTRDRLETTRGSAGLLWVFRDATFEKREEVLSRSVLSLISHKLKTPLMACVGYLEILAKDPPNLKGFHKKAFESMVVQHQRLSGMVEKLLFFASVYSPDMLVLNKQACDALQMAESARAQLGDYIADTGARVTLDEDSLDSVPKLFVDRGRVEEALRNLIENAIKFNPKPDKQVSVRADAVDGAVRFSVRDNGPGIPAEEHLQLFRKFYQMEDSFTGQIEGMGLGLAFVKNIADAHGGEASVKSAPGQGTEFTLSLPRADPV